MRWIYFVSVLLLFACSQNNEQPVSESKKNNDSVISADSIHKIKTIAYSFASFADTVYDYTLVNVTGFSPNVIFDMIYSTENNFFKQKFYDCPNCYLRFETVKALYKTVLIIEEKGYRLKIFDCFRPFSVQKEMWKVLPNRAYVADPARGGSIHNKGIAVDVTLTDKDGKELDMGTEFDHFGVESAHSYTNLDSVCINNRKFLRTVMEQCGFVSLETEWWHYTFKSNYKYSNADLKFNCR